MAESIRSAANHDSTVPITLTIERDSHSERTRTSLRDRSNETDDRSNSSARRCSSPRAPAASATATRISTIGSLQGRSFVADRCVYGRPASAPTFVAEGGRFAAPIAMEPQDDSLHRSQAALWERA